MPSFTKADIRRAIEAVEGAGKHVAAVDFPREGGFRLVIGPPGSLAPAVNEWDEVLAETRAWDEAIERAGLRADADRVRRGRKAAK